MCTMVFLRLSFIIYSFLNKISIYCYNSSSQIEDLSKLLPRQSFEEINNLLNKNFPLVNVRIILDEKPKNKKYNYYKSLTSNYFLEKCKSVPDMCEYGYEIDIYSKQNILVIEPGSNSKKLIDPVYCNRIIFSLQLEIKSMKYASLLKKILIFINFKQNGGTIKDFPTFNYEPHSYIFYILIPSFIFGISILTFILYYESLFHFSDEVKEFFDGLLKKWEAIDNNGIIIKGKKQTIIEHGTCIFCWKKTKNENEIFLYCGHSYHETCLRQWRVYIYGCCPCSYQAYESEEKKRVNNNLKQLENPNFYKGIDIYISEDDLKILLSICLDAFRKDTIFDYFIENEEKINEFNDKHELNTLEELCWIHANEVEMYKSYKIWKKLYKVLKMACFYVSFYPKFLKSKKVVLIYKLLKLQGFSFEKMFK